MKPHDECIVLIVLLLMRFHDLLSKFIWTEKNGGEKVMV